MHVSRIGLAALKGTRHLDLASVDVRLDGPVGDRVFCLVDRDRGRVLRTVENPSLLETVVSWRDGVLTTTLRDEELAAVPVPTGETLKVDYWGRLAALDVVEGPWADAFSRYLGYDVVLVRSRLPGEIVFGGSVSLVTTSSLARLAEDVGPVDERQFRATMTIDTDGEQPFLEDRWHGRRLRLGDVEVEVRGAIPRCAVIGLDPVSGLKRSDVLRSLGGYRRVSGEVVFGVDAVVTRPGSVDVGAAVVERG
jgi:MOSC domain-containing protein